MKASQILPIAMGLPALTNAQAAWSWSIEDVPEEGLTDITFPMSIKGSEHIRQYYFAFQYPFIGVDDIGYTGLQPQEDADNGTTLIRGVFSNFITGATSDDEQCHDGADGGDGISCGVIFESDYDQTYNMVIKNTAGTTWTGTAVNAASGEEHHIGTYTLPSSAKGIKGGHMGFTEHYRGEEECANYPVGAAVIGDPFSSSGAKGTVDEPFESGDCVGDAVNWKQERDEAAGTWTVSLGG